MTLGDRVRAVGRDKLPAEGVRGKRGLALCFAALLLCAGTVGAQALVETRASKNARIEALLEQSANAMAGVYDYRGTLVKRELFGDELVEQTIEFKFSRPFKVYVILHHNDEIDGPADISEGQQVFVPRYYASRGEYFIGKRTFMMVKARSWDYRGNLYESYEYTNLELNPGLEARDFDYRNKDYDFVLIDQR
jgi:outer membrane lipoprotein-sorting protein